MSETSPHSILQVNVLLLDFALHGGRMDGVIEQLSGCVEAPAFERLRIDRALGFHSGQGDAWIAVDSQGQDVPDAAGMGYCSSTDF